MARSIKIILSQKAVDPVEWGDKPFALNLVDIKPPGQSIPGEGFLFACLEHLLVEVVSNGSCFHLATTCGGELVASTMLDCLWFQIGRALETVGGSSYRELGPEGEEGPGSVLLST